MRKLFAIALAALALPAWAQSPVTLVTGPAPCSLGGPSCNVPVDSGGTVFFRYTPSSNYGNKINVGITPPDFSEAIGPVPATLVQTVNAGYCSHDSRFTLTVPEVEVRDSAGNKYTFSGVQRFNQYYYRGGGGRGGGGAGCHYGDLGNG